MLYEHGVKIASSTCYDAVRRRPPRSDLRDAMIVELIAAEQARHKPLTDRRRDSPSREKVPLRGTNQAHADWLSHKTGPPYMPGRFTRRPGPKTGVGHYNQPTERPTRMRPRRGLLKNSGSHN